MNKEETIVNVVALTVGAAIGFGVGYYIQKRKYEKWFSEDEKALNMHRKEGVFATPQGAVQELIGEHVLSERIMDRDEVSALLVEQGYAPLNNEDTFDVAEIRNETGVSIEQENYMPEDEEETNGLGVTADDIVDSIWKNSAAQESAHDHLDPTVNEDREDMPAPDPEKPYIITVDEFMTETKYDDNKVSLLYYEGDGQMVDERDQLVNNIDELVGETNLHRFGLGSRDRNALYIRNDKKKMDLEIIRDVRAYEEVVLGIKPVQRSSSPRRMREDDQ